MVLSIIFFVFTFIGSQLIKFRENDNDKIGGRKISVDTYDSNFFVTSLKFKFLTSGGPLAALFCRVRRRSALTSYSASFLYNFSFVLNLCSLSTFGAFSFSSVSSFSFIFPFMIAFSIIFYFRFSNNLLTLASCFAIFL